MNACYNNEICVFVRYQCDCVGISPLLLFVLVFVFVLWAAGSEIQVTYWITNLCTWKHIKWDISVPLARMDCFVFFFIKHQSINRNENNKLPSALTHAAMNSGSVVIVTVLIMLWCIACIPTCISSFSWIQMQIYKNKNTTIIIMVTATSHALNNSYTAHYAAIVFQEKVYWLHFLLENTSKTQETEPKI